MWWSLIDLDNKLSYKIVCIGLTSIEQLRFPISRRRRKIIIIHKFDKITIYSKNFNFNYVLTYFIMLIFYVIATTHVKLTVKQHPRMLRPHVGSPVPAHHQNSRNLMASHHHSSSTQITAPQPVDVSIG